MIKKKWRKTMIKKNLLVINYLLIKKNEERPWFNYTLAKDDFFFHLCDACNLTQ